MGGAAHGRHLLGRIMILVGFALGWRSGEVRADSPDAETPAAESLPANDDRSGQPFFALDTLDANVEFVVDYDHTRVDSPAPKSARLFRRGRTQSNEEWGFDERLGFRLGGFAVDPSFLRFGGDISFGLTQDHFEERTEAYEMTDRDRGQDLWYDLRADFFTGKKFSGSLHGRRTEDRINRRFQPTLEERRTGFGTNWQWADERLPMTLSYDYQETEREGNFNKRNDESFTESTLRYTADWNIADFHTLKFSYEHAENKQEYQGSRTPYETTRDLIVVDHELQFGLNHQHSFRTRAHWQEESGDFARDYFEIGPQLTLDHGDGLQSVYKYQFNRERYEGLDVETHRADFQLRHQLYTNLTTTFDVFGLYEDVDTDVVTRQGGGFVDWQYNRKNPYGHLYANLHLAYDTEDVSGDNGTRVVLNESATLRDPFAVILRHRDVVPASIVVTDAASRRVYRLGIDYLVSRRGTATLLTRVRTGLIADGDTVLVDYLYRTPADGTLDTLRTDFSLEQKFSNGLTPYYRLSYRNQEDDVTTGFARRADRTDHHRLGLNYQRERYVLGAEYEVFDDTIDPYHGFHLNGTYYLIKGADHTLDLGARFSRLFFEGGVDRRHVSMLDVSLDHRWRVTDSFSTVERVAYRLEDDSVGGVTQAWDVSAGVEYVLGELSCELTLDYDRLALPDSEEDDYGVFVRVRREFPNVLAGR